MNIVQARQLKELLKRVAELEEQVKQLKAKPAPKRRGRPAKDVNDGK